MNLQLFQRPDAGPLRTFVDTSGTPWFCATDVTSALGYANGRQAVASNCLEKGVSRIDTPTPGGNQLLSYLSEANLYRLVLRSRVPGAEAFQEWVCEEVLPAIRRTGQYTPAPVALPQTYSQALRALADKADEAEQLRTELETARPAAAMLNALQDAEAGISMEEVAKLLAVPGLGRNNLFELLRREKVLIGRTTRPYQYHVDAGRFKVIQQAFVPAGGEARTSPKTVVLPKGVDFIRRLVQAKAPAALARA